MDFIGYLVQEFSELQWSWLAFGITAVVVIIAGLPSVSNKKQGVIVTAELIFYPAAAALTTPYMHLHLAIYFLLALAGFIVSWGCHWLWSPKTEKVEHMKIMEGCVGYRISDDKWWESFKLDMHLAGWINLVYMIAQIVAIGAYLLSPMPATVVRKVWVLLLSVSAVAVIKPAVMQGWHFSFKLKTLREYLKLKWVIKTAITAFGLWIFFAIVTWIKLKSN